MTNKAISTAINQLKQEHIRLCKELARVDEALSVLGNVGSLDGTPAKRGRKPGSKNVATKAVTSKRKVSAAARKKMSEAARARWAARKKEKAQ